MQKASKFVIIALVAVLLAMGVAFFGTLGETAMADAPLSVKIAINSKEWEYGADIYFVKGDANVSLVDGKLFGDIEETQGGNVFVPSNTGKCYIEFNRLKAKSPSGEVIDALSADGKVRLPVPAEGSNTYYISKFS